MSTARDPSHCCCVSSTAVNGSACAAPTDATDVSALGKHRSAKSGSSLKARLRDSQFRMRNGACPDPNFGPLHHQIHSQRAWSGAVQGNGTRSPWNPKGFQQPRQRLLFSDVIACDGCGPKLRGNFGHSEKKRWVPKIACLKLPVTVVLNCSRRQRWRHSASASPRLLSR